MYKYKFNCKFCKETIFLAREKPSAGDRITPRYFHFIGCESPKNGDVFKCQHCKEVFMDYDLSVENFIKIKNGK